MASYLRIIHKILKPNGVWINLGASLWLDSGILASLNVRRWLARSIAVAL